MKRKPRVLLYCPTYVIAGKEQIRPETRKSIAAVKFDGVVDKVINSESKYPPPNYENTLAHYQLARQRVLDERYDALLTVEHDIIIPPDGLQKLWNIDKPVAYGVYILRGSANVVNAFRMVDSENPDMPLSSFDGLIDKALKDVIVEVSGVGNGCTLIRREILEKIPFRRNDEDSPIPDWPFAKDCKKAGIKQYAHFGVQCGHVSDDGILWLTSATGNQKTRVEALQDFVGSDGVQYCKGNIYEMDISLIKDYKRAGFIKYEKESEEIVKKTNNRKTITIRHHQNKARILANALKQYGFNVVDNPIPGDALLIDHDIEEYGNREYVERYHTAGKPVFIYPHGATPILFWDGMYEPSDMVKANFVTSKGHQEVMSRYGYPVPTHVIGWYLCDLKPWKRTDGYKVLFAPIHPVMNYVFMYSEDLKVNRRTYERLLEIDDIDLTVRHVGKLEINGLWEESGVTIYNGKADNSYDEIDKADLVIGNGTFAYMAIARGKPTIMMNQMTGARNLNTKTKKRLEVASIDKYADYMRYPYDVDNGDDLKKIMRTACRKEPKQWRKRFIGEKFDPQKFAELVEGLMEG